MKKLKPMIGFGIIIVFLMMIISNVSASSTYLTEELPSNFEYRFDIGNSWIFQQDMYYDMNVTFMEGGTPTNNFESFEGTEYVYMNCTNITSYSDYANLTFDVFKNNTNLPNYSNISNLTDFDFDNELVIKQSNNFTGMMNGMYFFPSDINSTQLLKYNLAEYLWSFNTFGLYFEPNPHDENPINFDNITSFQKFFNDIYNSVAVNSTLNKNNTVETINITNNYIGNYTYEYEFSARVQREGEGGYMNFTANISISIFSELEFDYNHVINSSFSDVNIFMQIDALNTDGTVMMTFQKADNNYIMNSTKLAESVPAPEIPFEEMFPDYVAPTNWYQETWFYWTAGVTVVTTGGILASYFGVKSYAKKRCETSGFDAEHPNLFKQFCAK